MMDLGVVTRMRQTGHSIWGSHPGFLGDNFHIYTRAQTRVSSRANSLSGGSSIVLLFPPKKLDSATYLTHITHQADTPPPPSTHVC